MMRLVVLLFLVSSVAGASFHIEFNNNIGNDHSTCGGETRVPEIDTKTVVYQVDGNPFEGYIAMPKGAQTRTQQYPAVLLVHGWEGVNPDTNGRADELAKLGYVAMSVDMYGQGIRPEEIPERIAQSSAVRGNIPLLKLRMDAALQYVQQLPYVQSSAVAAAGYCFGGSVVLQWAFTGAPVAGVVSFHGGLSSLDSSTPELVTAKILIANGQSDDSIAFDDIVKVQTALVGAKKDYRLQQYAEARHCFTYVAAQGAEGNCAYNQEADMQSHASMRQFLKDIMP